MKAGSGAAVIALALIAGTLIGLDVAALGLHVPGQLGIGSDQLLRVFVWLMMLEMVLYAIAVLIVLRARLPRSSVVLILAGAILMRALLLFSPPFLSTDLYRYVWDGMVQNNGINPYRYRPDAPALAGLRDRTIYPGINRKATARTIYPPFAEAIYALAARLSPTLLGMKAMMTAFDLVAIAALLSLLRRAGRPLAVILIYAWQPLVIWEFAGNAHVDAIVAGCVALALLAAAARRPAAASVALTASILAKFLPGILLPALWRPRGWRFPVLMAAIVAVSYAAYSSAGWHVAGFLPGYVHQEGIANGLGIFYLQALESVVRLPPWAGKVYLAAVTIALVGLGIAIWRRDLPADETLRTRRLAADAAVLATALMVILTPHYPWYFTWLLVPLCIAPSPASLYLPAASFLLYLDPIHTRLLWPALIYGPFAVLLLGQVVWRQRHREPGTLFRSAIG